MSRRSLAVTLFALVALGIGAFVVVSKKPTPAPVEVKPQSNAVHKVIGKSVQARDIESYTFGNGKKHIVFVGGMHGGYEWNSVELSYVFIDYLEKNPQIVPTNLTVTIIPSINPDGVYKVTHKVGRFLLTDVSTSTTVLASGRFNANNVDLNRNFDCNWKPKGIWKSKTVSGGSSAFSEPEAQVLKSFVTQNSPTAFVFWHSQANAVYASQCKKGILPETLDIMNAYSKASLYPAVKSFDSYEVTGDAEGWLASINIPTITVELKTHESIEWEKNLLGIKALFTYYNGKK